MASFVSIFILLFSGTALSKDVDWDSLNLTPQQESQLDRLEGNWKKTHEEVGTQIEQDTSQLRTILPTGDTQQIRQLQSRITANKLYLMNQSMDTFLKKRDLLTPNQRTQLQRMLPANVQDASHNR